MNNNAVFTPEQLELFKANLIKDLETNKDLKPVSCYPCNDRGYHIESTTEPDGSVHREKISCACCSGLAKLYA